MNIVYGLLKRLPEAYHSRLRPIANTCVQNFTTENSCNYAKLSLSFNRLPVSFEYVTDNWNITSQ